MSESKSKKRKVRDEEEDVDVKEDAKSFRFNRKDVFLTYAQCDIGYKVILEQLKLIAPVAKWLGCDEKHADGNQHSHLYVQFQTAIDSKNIKVFDVRGYHPNIKKPKKAELSGLFAYIMKDGHYEGNVDILALKIDGFNRRRQDLNAFIDYVKFKGLKEVEWPITLPCGMRYNPTVLGKKRHIWIVGRPSMGKTTWVQDTFAGCRVFCRAPTEFPFETYEGEEVIIYDDIIPKFSELSAVSNVYKIKTHVPGKVRYRSCHWPLNQERIMIVLSNELPQYGHLHDAFLSRFVVIDYSEREDVVYPPRADRELEEALAQDVLIGLHRAPAIVIEQIE